MNRFLIAILILSAACHHRENNDPLALIQIQDRNGLTETISNPERLTSYETVDFLSSQPYKKVLRVYKNEEKNSSRITTYHPNGTPCQYLEAQEMRANGAYKEWFPNGQIRLEAKVIGGTADLFPGAQEDWIFDSISQVWDEKGNLIASIPYNKGFLDGKSIYYFPSGQVQRELNFVTNKQNGEEVEYYLNGVIKSKTEYKKGVKEGDSLGFFENGKIAWIEDHSDGRLRKGSYYNLNGDLVSEVDRGGGYLAHFEDDEMSLVEYRVGLPEGLVRNFNLNGDLLKAFFLKNGMKQGDEIEYFLPSELEEGNQIPAPKLSLVWKENRIHGCVKTWYNNGQLQSQREYCRNQKTGPSLAWYRDGSLMLYEEYEEDRLITGQYYKWQKKDPISSISNGNGLATLFDGTGGFLRKITYLRGKPVDPED